MHYMFSRMKKFFFNNSQINIRELHITKYKIDSSYQLFHFAFSTD